VSIAAITKARKNGIIMLTFPHVQAISSSHWTYVSSNHLKTITLQHATIGCWLIKPILIYNVGHLIGVTYPSAFNHFEIQSGFCGPSMLIFSEVVNIWVLM
jgi:hypothetical protein